MKTLHIFTRIFLTLISALTLLYPSLSYGEVNLDGSFTYTVNIKIPPGTKGIEPKLSLSYSSDSGNGIAGVGWQLTGLPYITRDTSQSLNYNGNDRYAGPQGNLVKVGGYYHYETEIYSRFETQGTQGDAPEYWIEHLPDGSKCYYGNTADSRVVSEMYSPSIKIWALSRVEDIFGNYYTVEYEQDSGQFYPKRIIYTQGTGITRYRTVEFEYEDRTDYSPDFSFISRIETRKRLKWITIKANVLDILGLVLFGDSVRKYRLDYTTMGVPQTSRLIRIQEIGSNDGALPPVEFKWKDDPSGEPNGISTPVITNAENNGVLGTEKVGDFNGDGLDDLALVFDRVVIINSTGYRVIKYHIYLSNGDSFDLPTVENFELVSYNAAYNSTCWADIVADFNGDGKDDILTWRYDKNRYLLYISNGIHFNEPITTNIFLPIYNDLTLVNHIKAGDFNGDGRTDILLWDRINYTATDTTTYTTRYNLYLSNGSGFNAPIITIARSATLANDKVGDFNGDGKSDLLLWNYRNSTTSDSPVATSRYVLYLSNGNGFDQPITTIARADNGQADKLGDFNGDGKTDLLIWNYLTTTINGSSTATNRYVLYLSNGKGFEQPTTTIARTDTFNADRVADFNNDGKSDLLLWNFSNQTTSDTTVQTQRYNMYISNGSGFISPVTSIARMNEYNADRLGDFNGDGLPELLLWNYQTTGLTDTPVSTNRYVLYSKLLQQYKPGLIVEIDNPLGGKVTVDYSTITCASKATDLSASAYPYIINKSIRALVNRITTDDGRGASYSTGYQYTNGMVYAAPRPDGKDLLFRSVAEINEQSGEKNITYYRQDDPLLQGAIERNELYSGDGNLVNKTENEYNIADSRFAISETKYTKIIRITKIKKTAYESGALVSQSVKNMQYDDFGNILMTTESATGVSDIITKFTFSVDETTWILNRPTEIQVTSNGSISTWERFNYTGNLLTSKESYLDIGERWISVSFGYDDNGNIVSITDPLGHIKQTVYDSDYRSFPVSVTDTKGFQTTAAYDPRFGVKISETDMNGNTIHREYDEFGRLKREIEPGDDWSKEVVYNDTGNPETQYIETRIADTSSTGYHYKRTYIDGLKREYRVEQKAYHSDYAHLDQIVDTEYDDKGRIKRKSNQYLTGTYNETPFYTNYEYDSLNRPTRIIFPDGSSKQFSYHSSGDGTHTESLRDQNGNLHKTVYNARGKVVQKIDPENATLSYQYNTAGNLTEVMYPDGRKTIIKYDTLGRKLSMKEPSFGEILYSYDDAGRLVSKRDAKGQVINYAYDEINRITDIDYPAGTPDVHYTYDEAVMSNSKGRVTSINDGISKSTFAYNEKGLPEVKTIEVDGRKLIFRMEYDTLKRMTALTYPDGVTINRKYSDTGLLKAVEWDGHPLVRYGRFKESEDGTIDTIENRVYRITGNNIETSISYDPATMRGQRIVSERAGDTPETLEDIEYGFDSIGNIKSITDNLDHSKSQTLKYDGLNRLVSADGVYGNLEYEYTSYGNLSRLGDLELNYTSIRPYAVSSDSNGNIYGYDASGNMTRRKDQTLEYDAENRLTKVTGSKETEAEYSYDVTGNRIKKSLKDGTVKYNIDGLYEIAIERGRDDLHTKYFFGYSNELVAQVTEPNSTLIAMKDPAIISAYYADNTLSGIAMQGYQYLNYMCGNVKVYRYFMIALLSLIFILIFGVIIYRVICEQHEKSYIPKWATRIAPALLLIVVTVFTFGGCEIGYDDSPEDSPWAKMIIIAAASGHSSHSGGEPVEGIVFFHPDYTGNISYVTNSRGEKICQLHYKPYGQIASITGHDVFRYKYNSQEEDTESGLLYYKARYYDPAIGRFITPDTVVPDPFKTQCYNRYAYVEGNPVTLQDPSGHKSKAFVDIFGEVILGVMGGLINSVLPIQAFEKGGLLGGLAWLSGGWLSYTEAGGWGFSIDINYKGFMVGAHYQETGNQWSAYMGYGYKRGQFVVGSSTQYNFSTNMWSQNFYAGLDLDVVVAGFSYTIGLNKKYFGVGGWGHVNKSMIAGELFTSYDASQELSSRYLRVENNNNGENEEVFGRQVPDSLLSEKKGYMKLIDQSAGHPIAVFHDWWVCSAGYTLDNVFSGFGFVGSMFPSFIVGKFIAGPELDPLYLSQYEY